MASAEQFLQLLEDKDLVSAQVLQAARRESQRTSPPPDAVGISLWLVQGQHITASQAERLLSAVMEKAIEKPSFARWQKGEPKPTEVLRVPIPPPPAPPKPEPRDSESRLSARSGDPQHGKSSAAAQSPLDDLELAPEPEPKIGPSGSRARPAVPVGKAPPAAAVPATAMPAAAKPAVPAKPASAGGPLEPLEKTMSGPLDSLIESEARQSGPFEESMEGPSLNPTAPKKFKLRHALRKFFRRDKSKVVKVKAADPRQVKLVLYSWGIGVFVILAAFTAFWFFSPADSTEILRKAEAATDHGEYAEAINQYDKYLKSYSKSTEADEVRTLRVLAELRRAVQQAVASSDWPTAFEVAQSQVQNLPKSASSDLLRKVGVALVQIADGLARQAQAKPDVSSVNRLMAITNTIDNDVPANLQPAEMVDGIKRTLRQCRQRVEGQTEIKQAVGRIGKAVAAGDLPSAYTAYQDLVRSFPEMVDNPDLTAAMRAVSAAQQRVVKVAEQALAVSRAGRPSDLIAAVPLAVQPVQGELPSEKGKLRFVVDRGTVYALNAATGKVLWRRFVALDSAAASGHAAAAKSPAVSALPIAAPASRPLVSSGARPAGGDAVICDPLHREVLRVTGPTGNLAWRLAVERPIVAGPVQSGKSLLLLTQDQRLWMIDAATGATKKYLQLPQAVGLPPIVDAAHGLIYLVAEQSNLYVLSGDPQAGPVCRQVLHLGHQKGTIAAAPAVAGDYLLVPVNDSPDGATICVLSIAKGRKDGLLEVVLRINVKGYIDAAPVARGSGAVVVTAQGGMFAIERNEAGDTPLRVTARVEPALDERSAHFAASDGRTFWLAGPQLTRYAVHSEEGQIVAQSPIDVGAEFAEAPVIDGDLVFCVARRPGLPGATVSAIDATKNEPVWQTWLAAPLAAAPSLGSPSGKLTAATASGGLFRLAPAELRAAAPPADPVICVQSARLSKPISSLLPLPEERYAICSGAETTSIAVYDPQEQDKEFRWLVAPRELSAAPAAFAGGVLAPCLNGQVFLLDPLAREDMLAKPYAISLPGVTAWNWRTPQPVDDKLAVLCDGDHRMIAVRLADGGLKEAGVAPLSKAVLVSPVAVLGKSVFVVDADDNLLSFVLPALSPGKSTALGGRCACGPQVAGKLVLAATDKDKLIAVDDRQQVVWKVELKYGPLAGVPFSSGDDIYLSSQSGIVWRISAADGKERGKVDAGCPLGTGPLPLRVPARGWRLIVGGHDGSLLEVKKP